MSEASYLTAAEKGRFSELTVLKSYRGWFVGTLYFDPDGWIEPGSRDTDYYASRADAENAFRLLTTLGDKTAAHFLRTQTR